MSSAKQGFFTRSLCDYCFNTPLGLPLGSCLRPDCGVLDGSALKDSPALRDTAAIFAHQLGPCRGQARRAVS